jgi:hypothetical protein
LQSSLRQDLGTLVRSLDRAGYHAETFTPATKASSSEMNSHDSRQESQRGWSGGGTGDPSQRRQQQSSKHGQHQAWLKELENSK